MNVKRQPAIYEQIARNIRAAAAKNGDSNSVLQISKRVLIPSSTLHDKMNDPKKFTVEDLQKISVGLGVEISQLVSDNR